MERFLTVGQQVLALFILIFIGVICGKKGILQENAVRTLADLTLLIATPCVIVESFLREVERRSSSGWGWPRWRLWRFICSPSWRRGWR